MAELFRYAAFISYSSKDATFARHLHRALEGFNIPTQLGQFDVVGGAEKKYLNRVAPVFKDREELPSGPLGELLKAALTASSALVVVCSPSSATSEWVEKEIRFFESLGRTTRIFAIITKDAPETSKTDELEIKCFPPALRHAARVRAGEVNAPDVVCGDARSGKDGFRSAWLKVVAGIIGVNVGLLIDRDRKRRRRRLVQIGAGTTALLLGALFAAFWVDTQAWRTRLSTVAENIASQGNPLLAASFALGGEPLGGASIPARSDRADAVLARVGSIRMRLDLGILGDTDMGGGFLLSDDGATVVIKNNDQTSTYYDLTHGISRSLGNFGSAPSLQLSADGGKLLAGIRDKRGNTNWTLIDLAHNGTTRELGQFDAIRNPPILSRSGTALVTRKEDGPWTYYDLTRDSVAQDLGPVRKLSLAKNGSALVTVNEDGAVIFYNLILHTQRTFAHVGLRDQLLLSENGTVLVILGPDASHSLRSDGSSDLQSDDYQYSTATYYDLTSGTAGRSLGRFSGFSTLSANGRALLVTQADGTGIYLDLSRPGTVQNLGRLEYSAISDDGTRLAIQNEDGVGIYYNFSRSNQPVTLGNLGRLQSFVLSADGTVLATRNMDGTGNWYNMVRGTRKNLGNIGQHNGGNGTDFFLSANGAALVTQSEYDHLGRYFDLVNETPSRDLGLLNFIQLSANGRALVTLNMDGNALYYDLGAGAPPHPYGAALAADVCRLSGDTIRPFPSQLRDPARSGDRQSAEDQNLFRTLRGRPWHPCDWRGLFAGREGFLQFWRLIQVRYFGAPDYACEERTASGHRDALSIARCTRMRDVNTATKQS